MNERGIKQLDLSIKSNIGQSTLSKIMKGEMKLTLQHIFKFSKALEVEPTDLINLENLNKSGNKHISNAKMDESIINEHYLNEQILLKDVNHQAFNGYINHTFHIYFYPTISSESSLLEGTILFKESEHKNYCKAELSLMTGQINANGENVYKKYTGELIISLTMGACYCILINSEIGEICFLNFKHIFLFNQKLACRVATMVSTSSGSNRLPIMQRALISNRELHVNENDNSDLDFVRGQLKLNNSEILIQEEAFSKLMDRPDIKTGDLKDFFDECYDCFETLRYLHVEESKIRAIDASSEIKARGISLLRNISINERYNKISSKTDEFVFQYIDNKEKSNHKSFT